jgi:hypothetical protein
MRAAWGVFALIAATFASIGAAAAQDYFRRLDMVGDQLRDLPREARFDSAAQNCRDEINRRRALWLVVWCDHAARAAVNQRTRDRRREFSEAEASLLWDVAWLQALEGVQDNGFFAAPLIDRVSIDDDSGPRRLIAYRLLGNLRGRDLRDTERFMRELAALESVSISPEDTLLVGRRQLLDALLAQPPTTDRLWAIAAATLTYWYEYRNAAVAPDALIADARLTADAIAPLHAIAADLTGNDRALRPLLLNAHASALTAARDWDAAQAAATAGESACYDMLWQGSVLCLDLGSNAAYAGLMKQLFADDPVGMTLPVEQPVSARMYGETPAETWCRAIIVGDVSDTGEFTNVRVAYENPRGACRNMALGYATARRYRPIAEAQPGTRRRNIVLRFALTAP